MRRSAARSLRYLLTLLLAAGCAAPSLEQRRLVALYHQIADDCATGTSVRILRIIEDGSDGTIWLDGHRTDQNRFFACYRPRIEVGFDEATLKKSLDETERRLGPRHLEVAVELNLLAGVYLRRGDYGRAEAFYQRALAIREPALPANHLDLAMTLHGLGATYGLRGDLARSEPLLRRAFEIREAVLGASSPWTEYSMSALARLYQARGEFDRAVPLFQRAVDLHETAVGQSPAGRARLLNNLARAHFLRGDHAKALPLYERAAAIFTYHAALDHPLLATIRSNLGAIHLARGDYAAAEPLLRESLIGHERSRGHDHPEVARVLQQLSDLAWRQGRTPEAVELRDRSEEILEQHLALVLAGGSEEQRRLYVRTLEGVSVPVSLHVHGAPAGDAALRLALTTVLRRKGRIQDATADSLGAVRRSLGPDTQDVFDRWVSVRMEMATLVIRAAREGSAIGRRRLAELATEAERLEARLGTPGGAASARAPAVTIERVQGALPPDAALVEIVRYRRYYPDRRGWGRPAYAAYVVRRTGKPGWVDLDDARVIEARINAMRETLRDPRQPDLARKAGRELDELVMAPIRPLLGDARHLLVSPDDALNLVPFAALVDEDGRYLTERFTISYLTSGRDLLRTRSASARSGPIVIADPDFDDAGGQPAAAASSSALRAPDFSSIAFSRLPGTRAEARLIADLLPGVRTLTSREATEASVKNVRAPSILHIATHGFFLADAPVEAAGESRDGPGIAAGQTDHPLLRAGLAFAGANRLANGDDDGIFTAFEASGLDLAGTRLVVLSACETGVGTVQTGEGVYGLRRALLLAGAEALVVSLWKVDDEATRDLMVSFYRSLRAGRGRADALRAAQLEMLREPDRRHPFFWASFIPVGDWRPLAFD